MSEITWKPITLEEVCKKLDAEPERGVNLYIDGVSLIKILEHDYPQLFHKKKLTSKILVKNEAESNL